MKLFEAGSLEAVKDIEKNGEIAISLSEIAPEGGAEIAGVPYSPEEDPEMKSAESAPLKERRLTRYQRRLQESKDTELLDFLKNSEDGSFEAFRDSEQYQNIQWNIQQYKDGIARLKRNGLITEEELPEGIPTKKPGQTYSHSGGEPKSSGGSIYSREGWEPKEKSSMFSDLETKYSVSNSRPGSEHLFEEMENIITDIALGRSDKRHALIAGDPGIGKCAFHDEKISISLDDIYAKEFEEWLAQQK